MYKWLQKWIPHNQITQDIPITHLSMLSSLKASTCNNPESNMVSGGHIGFRKCKNNIRNEFPIPKLCKIDPLHTFPCSLAQKLMIASNLIWLPVAILDLRHFPESDWWGFLGCDYCGTKGMKSAEKPFVRIFSTLGFILTGLWRKSRFSTIFTKIQIFDNFIKIENF